MAGSKLRTKWGEIVGTLSDQSDLQTALDNAGGGNLGVIDLGMVNIYDAIVDGRANVLIPYADGRIIKSVRFIPGGTIPPDLGFECYFATPNTMAPAYTKSTNGLAKIDNDIAVDTVGLLYATAPSNTGIKGLKADSTPSDASQIADCGPLIAAGTVDPDLSGNFFPLGEWQAITAHCLGDRILDVNGHIQRVTTNGITGSSLPIFDTSGSTTIDGTVVWTDTGVVPTGTVHAIAEVIEGISPMPPYPATLEFVAPPQDVVAGEAMDDITVIVKDQNDDPYTFTRVAISLKAFGDGDAALNDNENEIDQTTGIATYSGLTPTVPGTYRLKAIMLPTLVADPVLSPPFDVTAP
jgi:hypothetical protein